MIRKSLNYFVIIAVALEAVVGLVWLDMLTFNAAARQADILVHQAWMAQHER